MSTSQTIELVVYDKDTVADGVVLLTLGRPDRGRLPAWAPGAHIDLHLGEMIRQYSLCSRPTAVDHYQVAVLREPESRGGSAYVHERLAPGDRLLGSSPRNRFALVDAKRYLFIAGGIGITPILAMIEATEQAGADWTLLYGGRTASTMAFSRSLGRIGKDRVRLHPEDEHGLLDLVALLATPLPDTAVYCCGPEPLLKAVQTQCSGWPPGSLHLERFTPADGATEPTTEFQVEFAQSGVTLTVPADRSIVATAEEAGVPVVYSCEEGTCGVCETAILAGEPDHRDSVLSEQERRTARCMMICVSRARSPRLVLDA